MSLHSDIGRKFSSFNLTIANNAALSAAFSMQDYAGGIVTVPSAWTAANIGFQVCFEPAGTFAILRDDEGTPVQISGILTNGVRAYAFPDKVFAAHWVKLWSKSSTAATETDTNQGGDRALSVVLKG